jgi:hypothetical protein
MKYKIHFYIIFLQFFVGIFFCCSCNKTSKTKLLIIAQNQTVLADTNKLQTEINNDETIIDSIFIDLNVFQIIRLYMIASSH